MRQTVLGFIHPPKEENHPYTSQLLHVVTLVLPFSALLTLQVHSAERKKCFQQERGLSTCTVALICGGIS